MLKFEKPAKHGEPWTPEEDAKLRELVKTHSRPAIAKLLGRSGGSVEGRATLLNLKLSHRRPKLG